jgi:hypothetical protein
MQNRYCRRRCPRVVTPHLRLTYADLNCLVLPPEEAKENEKDWRARDCIVRPLPGKSFATYSAATVGLMAAHGRDQRRVTGHNQLRYLAAGT